MHIGLAIGAIVATFFILLDAFYLKKKWASSNSLFSLRATALLLIFVVVGTLHYLLEKIWDVI
jgi:Mg2+/Co2+ transporter CorB